jgi:hypothetical protein
VTRTSDLQFVRIVHSAGAGCGASAGAGAGVVAEAATVTLGGQPRVWTSPRRGPVARLERRAGVNLG